jgi:hypothetical protein
LTCIKDNFVACCYAKKDTAATRDEAKEGWRKLDHEMLHNGHTTPNMIRAIKSSGTNCAEHVQYQAWKGQETNMKF